MLDSVVFVNNQANIGINHTMHGNALLDHSFNSILDQYYSNYQYEQFNCNICSFESLTILPVNIVPLSKCILKI